MPKCFKIIEPCVRKSDQLHARFFLHRGKMHAFAYTSFSIQRKHLGNAECIILIKKMSLSLKKICAEIANGIKD